MKKLYISIITLCLFMIGCSINDSTTTFVSNEDFLDNTQINSYLLDCEFYSEDDAEEFQDLYNFESVSYIETFYSELQTHLEELEYYSVINDIHDLDITSESGVFVIIPVYETWVFEEIILDYSYQAGLLKINILIEITNFPASTIKLLIVQIDSIYEYDLEIEFE